MINDLAAMFDLSRTAVMANLNRLGAESRRGIVNRLIEEASSLSSRDGRWPGLASTTASTPLLCETRCSGQAYGCVRDLVPAQDRDRRSRSDLDPALWDSDRSWSP
jgi:hypothetical protein